MKFSGTMLGSEDPKKLAAFYEKLLGKLGWQEGDWYAFSVGADLVVGPHSAVKGMNQNPERIMLSFESDDVKAEFDRIKGLGAKVVAEPYKPDQGNDKIWLATLADPDGNYFQLTTPWE